MNRVTVALAFLGYGLCYWGSTLINGGPGNTGAWSLLYTLTRLGKGPEEVPVKAGAPEAPPIDTAATGTGPAPPSGVRPYPTNTYPDTP